MENTEKAYMDTIFRKTGALMEACCRVGAILGGANRETEEAVASYGKNIGIAFQLVDDALDFTGDESLWGKPLGADLAEGKGHPASYKGARFGQSIRKRDYPACDRV